MRIEPVFLFDLDGTLVDSVYQHVLAWKDALDGEGIDLSVWRIHRKIGMSGGLFTNQLLRETNMEISEERVARLRRRHAEAYKRQADSIRPLPGARELLSWLTDAKNPTRSRRDLAQRDAAGHACRSVRRPSGLSAQPGGCAEMRRRLRNMSRVRGLGCSRGSRATSGCAPGLLSALALRRACGSRIGFSFSSGPFLISSRRSAAARLGRSRLPPKSGGRAHLRRRTHYQPSHLWGLGDP